MTYVYMSMGQTRQIQTDSEHNNNGHGYTLKLLNTSHNVLNICLNSYRVKLNDCVLYIPDLKKTCPIEIGKNVFLIFVLSKYHCYNLLTY